MCSPSPAAAAEPIATAKSAKLVDTAPGDTPKTKLKVKLTVKGKDAESGSGGSRDGTPQPATRKVTLKVGKKKLADDLKNLGDEDADESEAVGPVGSTKGEDMEGKVMNGKRDRRAITRRRAVLASDDEDEEDAQPTAPQRKRPRMDDKKAASKPKSNRKENYSDDDSDEEMVDAASESDLDAGILDSDEEFSDSKAKSSRSAKPARQATKAVPAKPVAKKPTVASNKTMSAEARMRASIDAAKDKSLKPPGAAVAVGSRLNPQASAFRPSATGKPTGGAATPTGTGGVRKVPIGGGKPTFGKSMNSWDQLFGPLSGLNSPSNAAKPGAQANKPSAAAAKANAAASSTGASAGIRPDPKLETASAAEVQKLKDDARKAWLSTDECFDLLAHADIMLAFERSIYVEDKRLSTRLRPAIWKAGTILANQSQPQPHPQT